MTIRTRFEHLEAETRKLREDCDLMKAEIRKMQAEAAPAGAEETKTEPAKGAAKSKRKAAGPA